MIKMTKLIFTKEHFFALVLLLFLVGCSPPYRRATQEEIDKFNLAIETNNVTLCFELDNRAEKMPYTIFSPESSFPLRVHCLYTIAEQTKNPQLCEQMVYVGDNKESFELYKEKCIKKATR